MASYVNQNLNNGEEVIALGELHWFHFMHGAFAVAMGIVLLISMPIPLGWLPILYGLFSLTGSLIYHYSTELALTNKRLIAKFGFIRRNTIELNHKNVESFKVEQNIFGRIFNFGTLSVNGTGGITTPIPHISAPLEFRKTALSTIEED